jgi:hypothetical protein
VASAVNAHRSPRQFASQWNRPVAASVFASGTPGGFVSQRLRDPDYAKEKIMRRLASSMLVATAALLAAPSLATAQTATQSTTTTTTTVTTPSNVPPQLVMVAPRPSYFNPSYYYKTSYYKAPPTREETATILANAGYTNATNLELDGNGTWTGTAMMQPDNHPVKVSFSRSNGIMQLSK